MQWGDMEVNTIHPHDFGDTPQFFGNADQKFPSGVSKGCCDERAWLMEILAAQEKNMLCNGNKYGGIDIGERCF